MLSSVFTADFNAIDGEKVVVALLESSISCNNRRPSHRELSEVQAHLTNLQADGIDAVRAGLRHLLVGWRRHQARRAQDTQLAALNVNHGIFN